MDLTLGQAKEIILLQANKIEELQDKIEEVENSAEFWKQQYKEQKNKEELYFFVKEVPNIEIDD